LKKTLKTILLYFPIALILSLPFFLDQKKETHLQSNDQTLVTQSSPRQDSVQQAPILNPQESKPIPTLTPSNLEKLKILRQILSSRNDNDPRLDTEFKNLTPEMKRLIEVEYLSLPPEKLNERGTLSFVLARAASSKKDLAFFKRILKEAPCLSFQDCSQAQPIDEYAESDSGLNQETLLAYPQIIALRTLSKNSSPELRLEVTRLIRELGNSTSNPYSTLTGGLSE
jgi:hypothetical protein